MTPAATSDRLPILYTSWASSCSWRVRIALHLKQIPYDIEAMSQQSSTEYRAINPMGQVPALKIDGTTLIESLAIMQYLEETRPQRPLLPHDHFKRHTVRALCGMICSGIQPLQNVAVLGHLSEEKRNDWAQFWIMRGFRGVEQLLSTSAGKYCVGDEISMADCCLVPQVFNARKFKVDLRPYPTIDRIDQDLRENLAFRDTHPSKQPDYPADLLKCI